jgi:hypothetical protein
MDPPPVGGLTRKPMLAPMITSTERPSIHISVASVRGTRRQTMEAEDREGQDPPNRRPTRATTADAIGTAIDGSVCEPRNIGNPVADGGTMAAWT